ncbi:hypothetical protein RRG08_005775 [Elysia crispata]|uniref:PiggyBac transposable element-derived protein 4 C-terminal zinc-ribbon domain-containing protein n=1 Tax=Elysia crispata TaxID=231223 RepID=A0AAE1A0R9_9GAST|nr:hypothetical protein RRG08_005775 [Elysia crispata]
MSTSCQGLITQTSCCPFFQCCGNRWKKPFFHLLTLASIQTNILLNKHRRQHGKRPMVSHIDVEHDADRDNVNMPLARIKERHFIQLCPETDSAQTRGKKANRQCKVCADKAKKAGQSRVQRNNQRKQTTTWCPTCKVELCIDCFEVYHTRLDYTS